MYTEIDKQWKENGSVTVRIVVNDLAQTGQQLEHLASLDGVHGFLALPPKDERRPSVFIPLETPTEEGKLKLVRRLLAVATIWQHYSHVRPVHQKRQSLPKGTIPYDSYRFIMLQRGVCLEKAL